MVPEPIRNNSQFQSLLNALKNICRDYPAGGGVLRELLQNADDAGATVVRFVLDERTHPSTKLFGPGEILEKYQGPALLAYNNAVFSDADFKNLRNLGNSSKINDGTTTGKFGRGFNSVYNWTDSPSIVSREFLVIFDPHLEWSGANGGGPMYDFVKHASESSTQNHMAAFQAVIENTRQPLDGTVIRIPLRTEAQAAQSKITNRATTVSDISDILRIFSTEFGESGLLFMRNVTRLEILSASTGLSMHMEMQSAEGIQLQKLKIKQAVKEAVQSKEYSWDYSFGAEIKYSLNGTTKQTKFALNHTIQNNITDVNLSGWMEDQKLIPWVALAAELPLHESTMEKGALFTVLPLPVATNQPISIHGVFSLSPDRARLHQHDDRNIQDRFPGLWNDYLLRDLIPLSWTKLLTYLAELYPSDCAFERWPHSMDDSHNPLGASLASVLNHIEENSLAVWPTEAGYKVVSDCFLATGNETAALKEALQKALVPVVYVPSKLHSYVKNNFSGRMLDAQHLYTFLKGERIRIRQWDEKTKIHILEYLVSQSRNHDYGGLELFPFEDGVYRSLEDGVVYLHRDEFERDLFDREKGRNVDLDKLSPVAKSNLKDACNRKTGNPSLQYRTEQDFSDYYKGKVFHQIPMDSDMIYLDEEISALVEKAWTWLRKRSISTLHECCSDLWLLPLTNGQYRKIVPSTLSPPIFFAPPSQEGDIMRKLDAESDLQEPTMLDTAVIAPFSLQVLMEGQHFRTDLRINDCKNMMCFADWLHRMRSIIDNTTDDIKNRIINILSMNISGSMTVNSREEIARELADLQIFRRISWTTSEIGKEMPYIVWTSLQAFPKSIGLLDGLNPVPEIEGVQFLDASNSREFGHLIHVLNVAPCLRLVQVIQEHIIPVWQRGNAEHWTESCKMQVSELLLRQYSCLSLRSQAQLHNIPFVPVAKLNGNKALAFSIPKDLIDPSSAELKDLFFQDEEVLPDGEFFRKFGAALKGCGMKSTLDEALIDSRIIYYASGIRPVKDVQRRVHNLLRYPYRFASKRRIEGDKLTQQLQWLPVVVPDGTLVLKASDECRGLNDRKLVGYQLPILDLPISPDWEKRIGWSDNLPENIILNQLKIGVQREDREVVDAVLAYVARHRHATTLLDGLKRSPCILTTNGIYLYPEKVFHPFFASGVECRRLHPFLGNVDYKFWKDHEELLKQLGVREKPSLEDLINVQKELESKDALRESEITIAIEILNMATRLPGNNYQSLKVLNRSAEFCPISEVKYHDIGLLEPSQEVNLTHPDIPVKTIRKLEIETLSQIMIKGMLDIEDIDDDDEFDQREKVTTRIADTLERYQVDATFKEYLANADDADGASRISWLLDDRTHASEKLLTPELKDFQGPALLVYNDGVFSEDDFEGLKNVGEGSKRHKKETIGQFGRGAGTMYHWTDLPMILSGKYLLILDPQQQSLPKNQRKGRRKAGVKLALSKLRAACPDQLAPFRGLWDYSEDLDYYPGTIFRFPLRPTGAISKLKLNCPDLNSDVVYRYLDNYFNEARISLLFLRRIRSIEFKVWGKEHSGWIISKEEVIEQQRSVLPEGNKISSGPVSYLFHRHLQFESELSGKDTWQVLAKNIPPAIDKTASPGRERKNIECGIAALLSSETNTVDPNILTHAPIQSRMFSTLPLPISSDLPVHIHATFQLSGDRQSLVVDEYGAESSDSTSNRYLLGTALPNLYLTFLEELRKQIHLDIFKFWPQEDPPKRSCSEPLCSSFWQELPKSSRKLFPKAPLDSEAAQREPLEWFDMSQAVFDFLTKSQSTTLAPLLLDLSVNLVHRLPLKVSSRIKSIPETKSVDANMLRTLLKLDRSKKKLELEIAKVDELMKVILRLSITDKTDLRELDGCHIIPLANGSLGTLKYESSDTKNIYFVSSEEEMDLFDFASSLLVADKHEAELYSIIHSEKFNLTKFSMLHVGKVLKGSFTTLPQRPSEKWLERFWKAWNDDQNTIERSSEAQIQEFLLCRANLNGQITSTSLAGFTTSPAIVSPNNVRHRQLCFNIPGLYQFDGDLMPGRFRIHANNLLKTNSFFKLISALQILANNANITVTAFVHKHLHAENRELLRNLTIHFVDQCKADPTDKGLLGQVIPILQSIPIWPSCSVSGSDDFTSAENGLLAKNHRLLVPWLKDYARFIKANIVTSSLDYECLKYLEAKDVQSQDLLIEYVMPLPDSITNSDLQNYEELVSVVPRISDRRGSSDSLIPTLTSHKFAIDGHQNTRIANELFDHTDEIFSSALRYQKESHFLHPHIRQHRAFWLKLGLRSQEYRRLAFRDYHYCLQIMASRLANHDLQPDAQLDQDIGVVLGPLTGPNSSIRLFDRSAWQDLSREAVFLSRTDYSNGPQYRRSSMEALAAGNRILRLVELVTYDHVACCWSQIPFPIHRPTVEVLEHIPGKGEPGIVMVWKHLKYLKDASQYLKQSEVPDFLSDVYDTYENLQNRLDESQATFVSKQDEIWLNLNKPWTSWVAVEDIRNLWYSMDCLVLSSSCDAGHIKAVGEGLMRFEKLLRALDCSSIVYPTVVRPVLHLGQSVSNSLRRLRAEGKMLDVTYETEGRRIQAHRVVLAALSEKCEGQFSGRWSDEVIRYSEADDPDEFISYHTLSTMIDYAYEDEVDWSDMQITEGDNEETKEDKLNLLLDLHKGADYWIIPTLKSQVVDKILSVGKLVINLDNVLDIRDRAEDARAEAVVEMCSAFIAQNRAVVKRAHSEISS
ncbi:hypothetical protein BGZ60DRAFT_451451 [Tricladium varicosporioides]|nr:hypothetical protein BGZ60DRAFT_451451 [Hymenoscyphus varicosporioides]